MTYRGPMILVRALQPGRKGEEALAAVEAALLDAGAALRPNLVSRASADSLLFRFRTRLTPAIAYRTVMSAAAPVRGRIDALVWVGPPGTTTYGNTSQMAVDTLAQIVSGTKTTCYSSLADAVQDGETLATDGSIVTALDHRGHPTLVYRVSDVRILPFAQLPQGFDPRITGAAAIQAWRKDHADYFRQIGVFDPHMPIVCERFALQRVLPRPADERTP